METGALSAISPLDGRYRDRVRELRPVFSEFGLIRRRVRVEAAWFRTLAGHEALTGGHALEESALRALDAIVEEFDETQAALVKAIESETNHDVKAVEYYLRERLGQVEGLRAHRELVHFACTSEDISNLAYALMLEEARSTVLLPAARELIEAFRALAHRQAGRPMLARTHGQAASPTTLGKEMAVFVARLERARDVLADVAVRGKMNGAVGNYNAHVSACPDLDWPRVARDFVEDLGLEFNPCTTQIEAHDWMAELFHALMRFNAVQVDLCRDLWAYISLGYFRQRAAEGEVGSSTMPHKVNPIDFENAEANLGISTALLEHLSTKLPVSRLQRDLSDSSASRNIGPAIGHACLALKSILNGLGKVAVDKQAIASDLENAWEILGEALQTVMRKAGYENAYELMKDLTRGTDITKDDLANFLNTLDLPQADLEHLKNLTPQSYIGLAPKLVDDIL